MKFLLIGGAGYIGSYVTKFLIKLNHNVCIIDPIKNTSGIPQEDYSKIVKFRQDELLKGATIIKKQYEKGGFKILSKFRPDVIIHLAALPIENPEDIKICKTQIFKDIPLTFRIVTDIKKIQSSDYNPKLVYMSSLFAYGDFNGWGVNESHVLSPKTFYGISKATSEFIIKSTLTNYLIIRTTSIYGLGDIHERAHRVFVNRAMKSKTFWVNGDAWLDFIYVKDLAEGIVAAALSHWSAEDFHISGGKAINLEKFARLVTKYYPKSVIEVKTGVEDRPKRGTLDNTKARVYLHWEPRYSLEEGVAEYIRESRDIGFG